MTKNWQVSLGCVTFTCFSVITVVTSVSTVFDGPVLTFEDTLISTLGAGMALFGLAITLVPFRKKETWAWWVLWYWPIFLMVHVIALGTVLPDLPLAVLAVVALLLPFRSFFPRHPLG